MGNFEQPRVSAESSIFIESTTEAGLLEMSRANIAMVCGQAASNYKKAANAS